MVSHSLSTEANSRSGLNMSHGEYRPLSIRGQLPIISVDREPPTSESHDRPTILVIEDDPDISDVLKVQLELHQFVPVCVADGLTALKWLDEREADLIILDVMMPGWDGIRVCKHIRRKKSASELPILILSALGCRSNDRVHGLDAGANDFLAKPFDLNELIARIRALLTVKAENVRSEAIMSRYLAREVRVQAKSNPNALTSRQVRHAVVVFADLRGFTYLSTQTNLYDLTDMLDQFFGGVMAIVDRHNGLILDLAGDELLAIFNVASNPSDAIWAAVSAAIAMQTFFQGLQGKWAEIGFDLGLGIGIHEGEVMLGNLGGKELMRYTATGNVVNIAHRLVELAHTGETVVSETVYQLVQIQVQDIRVTSLSGVTLKGLDEPQHIYKLYGLAL